MLNTVHNDFLIKHFSDREKTYKNMSHELSGASSAFDFEQVLVAGGVQSPELVD